MLRLLLLLFSCGCAASAVPALTPDGLVMPRLELLEPRELAIRVDDTRAVSDEDRRQTEEHFTAVLGDVLRSANVKVSNEAQNTLSVTLTTPSQGMADVDPQSCVEMLVELKQAKGDALQGTSLGCAEVKSLIGISYGADTSAAFRQAANVLLRNLDGQYFALQRMMEPPRFEASRIDIPSFAKLTGKALALGVQDTWSADGRVGVNLREELEKALRSQNIDVTPGAAQQLTLTIRKPEHPIPGRSRDTCLEITVDARLERGTAFGHASGCQGAEEKMHHRVLNEVLSRVDAEYARILTN